MYPGFVDAVNLYFDKLVSVIKPLMVSQTDSFVRIFHVKTIHERTIGDFSETNVYFLLFCSFQFEEGGPIIAVQVENEYGSYAKDDSYMPFIKNVSLLMYCNVSLTLKLSQYTVMWLIQHIIQ